jgi:TIGR03009 family protein
MRQGSGGLVLLGLGLLVLTAPLSVCGQDYGPLRDERMPPGQQRPVYDGPQGQGPSQPQYNQPQQQPQYNQPQPPNAGPGNYGPPPAPRLERVGPPNGPQAASQGPPNGPNPQAGPPPAPPGFDLTKDEQEDLDKLLSAWEKRGDRIKSFECTFTRLLYRQEGGSSDKPKAVEKGLLKYAAPDKGYFDVESSSPSQPEMAERWICDGRSIFRYDFVKQRVIEYPLPPDLHGKEITNGPLPFLFGAEAIKLKQRYFLKVVPPPAGQGGQQVWLVAKPRFREDAQNFSAAEMILKVPNLEPIAIRLYSPNPNIWTVFAFDTPKINAIDLGSRIFGLKLLQGDPFKPDIPPGWTKELDPDSAAAQASRANQAGRR